MAIVARKRKRGTTYYVAFTWEGKQVWERVGKEKREAVRLDALRAKEIAAGTYTPEAGSRATTVRQWAAAWLRTRSNRSAEDDRARIEQHVLTRPAFADLPIADVRPRHVIALVKELDVAVSSTTRRVLSPKMVANVYGALRTMFRDAQVAEITTLNPCVVPAGTVRRKRPPATAPYSPAEVLALVGPLVRIDRRVFNALALFTGMREGEVCGRRWRDWDRDTTPLGCLMVDSQYDGQPLKTDQPRRVPVHPALAEALAWWHREGFELAYCRKPKHDDHIVLRLDGEPLSRSSAYKSWLAGCREAGVTSRSLHKTRGTFISLARRGGARKDVLERITHNAGGDIVDGYTFWDWAPLCEAVVAFDPYGLAPALDANLDASRATPKMLVEAPGIEAGAQTVADWSAAVSEDLGSEPEPPKRRRGRPARTIPAARQARKAGPVPAFCVAFDAADAYVFHLLASGEVEP